MIGKLAIVSSVVALAVSGAVATAAIPQFHPGVKIEAGGQPIDVEIGHLVPTVGDWNGDAKKDLVVGQFLSGKIRLYLNEGSDAAPVFKRFTYLQAGGAEISLPAG
ncbi:MAG: hypothetical protein N3D11_07010 [Candidatus Sumerlaeia bacterium]|nr:hypothetical protein [Candidatus Sumerlaeia bacterium]